VPHRPTSWQTFLKVHWGVIASADFFTTEVSTWRGMIPIGERRFRRAVREFVAHYHGERNHQGLQNRLITGARSAISAGASTITSGGLLNYYERTA
jgi:hypothetical protein